MYIVHSLFGNVLHVISNKININKSVRIQNKSTLLVIDLSIIYDT
jgi:hypothetical protein